MSKRVLRALPAVNYCDEDEETPTESNSSKSKSRHARTAENTSNLKNAIKATAQLDFVPTLLPILDALTDMKESVPFRGAIKEIRLKLLSHEYLDGWSFIDAVWNIFNNARKVYSKRSEEYHNGQSVRLLLIENVGAFKIESISAGETL